MMQCQELEHVLEEDGGKSLPAAAQAHLEGCGACRTLVEDLERIELAARELPAEVEPPERVWVSLRAQLEAEKIIRPEPALMATRWQTAWGARFLRPAMAVAAVSALILAVVLVRRPGPDTFIADHVITNPYVLTQAKEQLDKIERVAVTSTDERASATSTFLRENLKIVDDFIASCEQTVRATPQNDLARDYLSGAYQQKAELLAAIQDRTVTGD